MSNQFLNRKVAERAESAGAELRYGSHVVGLIKEDDFVKGVIVDGKNIRSKIVLSAEGLSRKFSNEAGLYESKPLASFYVVAEYLQNLKLNKTELGSVSIFGGAPSSLSRASLMFHTVGDDKAMILLSVLLPRYRWPYEKTAAHYLGEYVSRVSWVNEIYKRGEIAGKKSCWIIVQKLTKLVTNGFMGAGDSVAPLGHSSNVIAMLMGKEAAVTASAALEKSDFSHQALSSYDRWINSKIFDGVEFEAKLILSMINFSDHDLNVLCECFGDVNLESFFIGTPTQQVLASLKLIFKPKIIKNWKLVKRLLQ